MTGEAWVDVPADSDFPLENLPVGVVRIDGRPRVATRIGEHVLPLGEVVADDVFEEPTANAFLATGPDAWADTRDRVQRWLTDPTRRRRLPTVGDVEVLLPVEVGDYVDFYCSIHHASRVGRLFRPDGDALLPNWRHVPIGYHGRTSTIVPSGRDVRRPTGVLGVEDGTSVRGPCRQLDFEAEIGFVVVVGNPAGEPVRPEDADDHVFGVVLVNDWSARDVQRFEYQPLGPFLGKSFATTMSPWIVPLAALAPHRTAPPDDVRADPALADPGDGAFRLTIEAAIAGTVVGRTDLAHLSWTYAQMYAHLTSNGATTRPGDLFATGTVSGPGDDETMCLLEATGGGADPVVLGDGSSRTWLEDGDVVELRAWAGGHGTPRIGFGRTSGRIVA